LLSETQSGFSRSTERIVYTKYLPNETASGNRSIVTAVHTAVSVVTKKEDVLLRNDPPARKIQVWPLLQVRLLGGAAIDEQPSSGNDNLLAG